MVNFSGKWKEHKNENWKEMMNAIGMPWLVQKVAGVMTFTNEIHQDGDKFVIKNPKSQNEFTVGEEFVATPPFDEKRKSKNLPRWDGEKLVVTSQPVDDPSAKGMKTTRELLSDDEMLITMELGDVICRRWLKRQ